MYCRSGYKTPIVYCIAGIFLSHHFVVKCLQMGPIGKFLRIRVNPQKQRKCSPLKYTRYTVYPVLPQLVPNFLGYPFNLGTAATCPIVPRILIIWR